VQAELLHNLKDFKSFQKNKKVAVSLKNISGRFELPHCTKGNSCDAERHLYFPKLKESY